MTTQLEDRLRTELRSMAGAEPASPFDGRAVLSAGRTARTRRRLAWATSGLVAAVTASAFVIVSHPGLTGAPPPVDAVAAPLVQAARTARADELLVPALQRADFTVMTWRPYSVQQGTGYGYWKITHDGTSYWLLLSLFHDRAAADRQRSDCADPGQPCSAPRIALGPIVIASPAWTQSVTDIGTTPGGRPHGRVLQRTYASGHVVEITVTAVGVRTLQDGGLQDVHLSAWADAIGDPFPS